MWHPEKILHLEEKPDEIFEEKVAAYLLIGYKVAHRTYINNHLVKVMLFWADYNWKDYGTFVKNHRDMVRFLETTEEIDFN